MSAFSPSACPAAPARTPAAITPSPGRQATAMNAPCVATRAGSAELLLNSNEEPAEVQDGPGTGKRVSRPNPRAEWVLGHLGREGRISAHLVGPHQVRLQPVGAK